MQPNTIQPSQSRKHNNPVKSKPVKSNPSSSKSPSACNCKYGLAEFEKDLISCQSKLNNLGKMFTQVTSNPTPASVATGSYPQPTNQPVATPRPTTSGTATLERPRTSSFSTTFDSVSKSLEICKDGVPMKLNEFEIVSLLRVIDTVINDSTSVPKQLYFNW